MEVNKFDGWENDYFAKELFYKTNVKVKDLQFDDLKFGIHYLITKSNKSFS